MSTDRKYGRAVTLSGFCFIDPRFDDLAEICDLAEGDVARIKMARLWQIAAADDNHLVTERTINRLLGDNGTQGIVECRLGRRVGANGMVRLSGTKTHLIWAERYQQGGKKRQQEAGIVRIKAAARDAKGRLLPRQESENKLDGKTQQNGQKAGKKLDSQKSHIQLSPASSQLSDPEDMHPGSSFGPKLEASWSPATPQNIQLSPASAQLIQPSSTSTSSSFSIGDNAQGKRDLENPSVCVVSPRARGAKNTPTVSSKLSATLLPDAWQPSAAARELATSLRLDLDGEARHFANLKRSQGHVSSNWDAAFCAFLDGSAKRRAPKPLIAPSEKPRRLKRIG